MGRDWRRSGYGKREGERIVVKIGRRGMGAGGGEIAMKTRSWRGCVEIGGGGRDTRSDKRQRQRPEKKRRQRMTKQS